MVLTNQALQINLTHDTKNNDVPIEILKSNN